MPFESNGLNCGCGGKEYDTTSRVRSERHTGRNEKRSALAYSCHEAQSNLASGYRSLSTTQRARWARTSPRDRQERESNDRQEEKMSVFGSIVSAIFGSKHAAGVTTGAGPSSPSPSSPAPSASATPAGATAAKPISRTEVEAILVKLAA